jgi:hypothetical protein
MLLLESQSVLKLTNKIKNNEKKVKKNEKSKKKK